MPPKKTTAAEGDAPAHPYTDGEIQLAFALLKRLPRPTYDADVVAAEIGSASGSSVRKRVSLATAKYGWFSSAPAEGTAAAGGENGGGSAAGAPKTPRAKKTPNTSGRKKKLQETEGGADEDEPETPSKKKPRTARKMKAEETVKEEGDEDAPMKEEDGETKAEEGTAGDDGQI